MGGEETKDGEGRLCGGEEIAGEDTDGIVTVLAIEKEEGDLEEMKEYIPDGSVVSERVSEGWMTCLRAHQLLTAFCYSAGCVQALNTRDFLEGICFRRCTLNG